MARCLIELFVLKISGINKTCRPKLRMMLLSYLNNTSPREESLLKVVSDYIRLQFYYCRSGKFIICAKTTGFFRFMRENFFTL